MISLPAPFKMKPIEYLFNFNIYIYHAANPMIGIFYDTATVIITIERYLVNDHWIVHDT